MINQKYVINAKIFMLIGITILIYGCVHQPGEKFKEEKSYQGNMIDAHAHLHSYSNYGSC